MLLEGNDVRVLSWCSWVHLQPIWAAGFVQGFKRMVDLPPLKKKSFGQGIYCKKVFHIEPWVGPMFKMSIAL